MLRLVFALALAAISSGCLFAATALIPGPVVSRESGPLPSDRPLALASSAPAGVTPTSPSLPPSANLSTQILGTWGGTLQSGVYVELTFLVGGNVVLQAVAGTLAGTYVVNGSTVTLQFPGEASVTHAAAITDGGDGLQLSVQTYRRIR